VPNTEPTLLSMLRVVGAPPPKVQDSVVELPTTIGLGLAVNVLIEGALGFTVIVILFVAVPAEFDAVKVYVVVAAGVTDLEVNPSTDPTPLSISRAVGAPPPNVHDNVADDPDIIVVAEAEKLFITGAVLTVTVTCFVADPAAFEAVKV